MGNTRAIASVWRYRRREGWAPDPVDTTSRDHRNQTKQRGDGAGNPPSPFRPAHRFADKPHYVNKAGPGSSPLELALCVGPCSSMHDAVNSRSQPSVSMAGDGDQPQQRTRTQRRRPPSPTRPPLPRHPASLAESFRAGNSPGSDPWRNPLICGTVVTGFRELRWQRPAGRAPRG
jgi:hypothetical protein